MLIERFPIVNGQPLLPKRLMIAGIRVDEIEQDVELCHARERNVKWLWDYWMEYLLPWPEDKHVAVSSQEVFVGESREEVLVAARRAHPEDKGILTLYAWSKPHIYHYLWATPLE